MEFDTDLPAVDVPIRIVSVSDDGLPVELGKPMAVRGKWLSKLRVVVQNVSPRTIVAGTLTILFPETGDGSRSSPVLTTGMHLGQVPPTAYRQRDGTTVAVPEEMARREAISVSPGQTMEFHAETYTDADQEAAYKKTYITRVKLYFQNFYFSDGSKWTGSAFLEPVPAPAVWKQVTAEEFLFGSKTDNP